MAEIQFMSRPEEEAATPATGAVPEQPTAQELQDAAYQQAVKEVYEQLVDDLINGRGDP